MEIIFDENKNNVFRGEKYEVIKLQNFNGLTFEEMQKNTHDLAQANRNSKIILLRPEEENNKALLFAALLSLEDPDKWPLQAVFKVKNCRKALEKYKPYLSFSVAAKYIFRLLNMSGREIYKDIQTLNYLGLEIKTDYAEKLIKLHLPNNSGKKYVFKAANLENDLILASFIKMLSLIKYTLNIDVEMQIRMQDEDDPSQINKEKLLRKLYWCAKPFLDRF